MRLYYQLHNVILSLIIYYLRISKNEARQLNFYASRMHVVARVGNRIHRPAVLLSYSWLSSALLGKCRGIFWTYGRVRKIPSNLS
jgi:hypothetical protein